MKNLHIIIYSSFPKYSGGRENWLANILPRINSSFTKIFLYVYKSNQPNHYNLSNIDNLVVKEVIGLRKYNLLFSILNLFTLKLLFLFDSLYFFRRQVRKLLKQELCPNDTILAMNSIIELQPAVEVIMEGYEDIKLVCSVRGLVPYELGNAIPYYRTKFYQTEKKLLKKCEIILANGYDTQTYLNNLGIQSIVIPNGVDVARFQSPNQTSSNLDLIEELKINQYKIILMVATLRKIKGIDDLLIAGKILQEMECSPYKLIFVGKGAQTPFINRSYKLGIKNSVVFMGEQKNIPGILNLADVVVCTSGGSGMSMSALEAMASGCPIVAWNSAIYKQLLTHMEDSYLAKYKNHQDLANGIKLLLEDPCISKKFSDKLKKKAKYYDWENVSDKLLEYL